MELLRRIRQTLDANDAWRARTLNLIASENVLSPAARSVLDSDLLHRYAEGHPGERYYEGTRYVDEIEREAQDVVCRIFGAPFADVRPMSGTVANEAVFSRLVPHGAPVLAHPIAAGGHISHARMGSLGKRTRKILPWPLEKDGYTIDVARARDVIAGEKPPLVVLGRSLFLFPEPIAELGEVCREHGTRIFYDGAHVLGLVAVGEFQDPLGEGADVLCGSTHKTFFGPQRGIVVAGGQDQEFHRLLDRGVFPGSSSNHHLFSLPALLVAALEIEAFGADYARDTVRNARALAAALSRLGFAVALPDRGHTASHQVAVDVSAFGGGKAVSARLCRENVICNMNLLPGERDRDAFAPRGIRLGVQEMTRYGMGPEEMLAIAQFLRDCLVGKLPIAAEVARLRASFQDVRYGYGTAALAATISEEVSDLK